MANVIAPVARPAFIDAKLRLILGAIVVVALILYGVDVFGLKHSSDQTAPQQIATATPPKDAAVEPKPGTFTLPPHGSKDLYSVQKNDGFSITGSGVQIECVYESYSIVSYPHRPCPSGWEHLRVRNLLDQESTITVNYVSAP